MTRINMGRLAAVFVIAILGGLTAVTLLAPTATCHGYIKAGQRGGVTHFYAVCRLR